MIMEKKKERRLKLHKEDLLLALLYARDCEPIRGSVRIMKQIFLFQKERWSRNEKRNSVARYFYKFVPYDYGPCSFDIYDDLDKLAEKRYIIEIRLPDKRYASYRLSEQGEYRAYRVLSQLPPSIKVRFNNIKEEFNRLPLYSLLSYVYNQYPKYSEKTVFRPF